MSDSLFEPSGYSQITVTMLGPITCIALGDHHARIDFSMSQELSVELLHAVESANSPLILIDLSGVEYFSSWFLTTLTHAWQKLRLQPDCRFGLCGLEAPIREVFKASRFEDLWEIYGTAEEAVQAWTPSE